MVGEILLISGDWQTRAFLLAELQEAGYEVIALPSVEVALSALASGRLTPGLVLLDTRPALTRAQAEQVLYLLEEGVPLVLIVGAYEARTFAPLREKVAAFLSRPLRVEDVVGQVRRLAPPLGKSPEQGNRR